MNVFVVGDIVRLDEDRAVNVNPDAHLEPWFDEGWVPVHIGTIVMILGEDVGNLSFYHALVSDVGLCRISVLPHLGVTIL